MAKTKTNVQYEVGLPTQNQTLIWNGSEWVLRTSIWLNSGNDIVSYYSGSMKVGDTINYQTVIVPNRDSRKSIGSHLLKFFEFFIRKIYVYDEIVFVGEGVLPVVRCSLKFEDNRLVYKDSIGISRIALTQQGDIELFKY